MSVLCCRFVHFDLDFEAVVGELNIGIAESSQAFVGFGMGQVVSDMGEPGAAGIQLFDEGESLIDGLMHGVRNVAQSVEDKFIEIVQESERGIRDGTEVGEVSSTAKAESENFHVAVEKGNWRELDAEEIEGRFGLVEIDTGNGTEFRFAVENVGEGAAEDLEGFFVGVDVERDLLAKIIGTNVVETHDVIGVAVGDENGVEAFYAGAEGLLAKIGSCVDDDILAVAREEQGRAEAVVMRVLRAADRAVACERGNAHGRAGAKNGDF